MRGSKQRKVGAGAKDILAITDANFDEISRKNELVLVDFWADWCGPCKALSPIVEKLAEDYAGKIAFGELDVDKNRRTCARFKVKAYPTLLIVKNGKEVDRIVGCAPRRYIEAALTKHLLIMSKSKKVNNLNGSKKTSGRSII